MSRPSFQFYTGDWSGNSNLKRCTHEEKGIWIDVLCVLHDQEEYGIVRWPLKELASAVGCTPSKLRRLVDKGVLKGADTGAVCSPMVFVPRSGRKDGAPVTLLEQQEGPLWYSSRMVLDEYKRKVRGAFGEAPNGAPNPSPNPPFGEGIGEAPNPPPKGTPNPSPFTCAPAQAPRADPSSSSSSSSSITTTTSEPIGSATASAAAHGDSGAGMTAQEAVWADAVPLLMAAGLPERQARSFLGQKVKAHGAQAVQDVILRCASQQPVEPVSWITAALGKAPERGVSAIPEPVAWWADAGFPDRYQAENAGCTRHNAHRWHDGKRLEMRA